MNETVVSEGAHMGDKIINENEEVILLWKYR